MKDEWETLRIQPKWLTVCPVILAFAITCEALGDENDDRFKPAQGELKVLVYNEGNAGNPFKISSDSEAGKALYALVASKKDKWVPSLITYAPTIYVTGPNFRITVQRYGRLIVEYTKPDGKSDSFQLVANITEDEFSRIAKLFKQPENAEKNGRG